MLTDLFILLPDRIFWWLARKLGVTPETLAWAFPVTED